MSNALIVLLLLAVPDGPATDEPAKHQGTWAVVSQVRDGNEAPADVVASIRRVVEGDHVTWTRDGKSFAGTRVEYDPSKTPHALDLIPDGGPNRDKRILAIYKLEGDDLTICVADAGEPRPTGFEAPAGSKRTLQKFKRMKPIPAAEDPTAAEFLKLQGVWQLKASTYRGEVSPDGGVAAKQMVFEGGRSNWVLKGKRNISVQLVIDPTKAPATMDCFDENHPLSAGTRLAIYRLDGDDLTICISSLPGEPRPSVFESKPGSKRVLWKFKRTKP